MTKEEEQEFKQVIANTILPLAVNMTEDKIREIMQIVEQQNPNLPLGFGNMLFEQILLHKYNK